MKAMTWLYLCVNGRRRRDLVASIFSQSPEYRDAGKRIEMPLDI